MLSTCSQSAFCTPLVMSSFLPRIAIISSAQCLNSSLFMLIIPFCPLRASVRHRKGRKPSRTLKALCTILDGLCPLWYTESAGAGICWIALFFKSIARSCGRYHGAQRPRPLKRARAPQGHRASGAANLPLRTEQRRGVSLRSGNQHNRIVVVPVTFPSLLEGCRSDRR